jgi:hypothetical protein
MTLHYPLVFSIRLVFSQQLGRARLGSCISVVICCFFIFNYDHRQDTYLSAEYATITG